MPSNTPPIQVHKFGGTSVESAERILNAAELLRDAAQSNQVVAVSSALGGITNQTLEASATAAGGNEHAAIEIAESMRSRHHDAIAHLTAQLPDGDETEDEVKQQIDPLFDELAQLLRGTALVRDLTKKTADCIVITGEKAAVRLIAFALRRLGTNATALDADTFLQTSQHHTQAEPRSYTDCPGIADAITPLLAKNIIPVVTGFCGRAPDGATTTLGRGGSDLSATLIAAALNADEAIIWTDVPGVFSADPRVVPNARRIERLHLREASEMSYYGAKVLHARTMIPVADKGIPVRIKSSTEPSKPGTLVTQDHPPTDQPASEHPIKAVTAIRDQAIIEVLGKGMVGVPGVASRVFTTLANASISCTMISQSSSEASVCLAVPGTEAEQAQMLLRQAFAENIADRLIEDIAMKPNLGIIAAVGLGMAHTPGIAATIFTAVAKAGVNILAIAQGSSELNISLAVSADDIDTAVRAIHADCIE